jgi:hypothetical protein
MSSTSTQLAMAQGRGSVTEAPNLPEGFTDTFTSRYVDIGDLRLHAVIGGEGRPLLLIHGWPSSRPRSTPGFGTSPSISSPAT